MGLPLYPCNAIDVVYRKKKPYLNVYTDKYAPSTTQNNRFIWRFLRLFKY